MARANNRPVVALERLDQLPPRRRVQVVRRFVQKQHVRRLNQELGQRYPAALPARKHAHRLEDVVTLKQELAQDRPQLLIDRSVGDRANLVEHCPVRVQRLVLVLVVVARASAVSPLQYALRRAQLARRHLQQCGLPTPVRPDEHDLLAPLDVQIHIQ